MRLDKDAIAGSRFITVRLARGEEVAQVVALYRRYDRLSSPITASDQQRIIQQIRRAGYVAVAVTLAGGIVGSYSMYVCPSLARGGRPFAVIESVLVAPDYRRQGVGRALMTHAQQTAQAEECYKVMLCAAADRPATARFYEACGFVGDKIGYQCRYL